MKKISVRSLSRGSMIAAIYTAVSMLLAPITFGAVQMRASEALTLLPIVTPDAVLGVTVGCLLTNAWGVAAGANILGVLDIPLGTLATFSAAILTRKLRNHRILAAIPPVIINAVVIGAELTFAETGRFPAALLALNMFQVGLGQAIACFALGLPLAALCKKMDWR